MTQGKRDISLNVHQLKWYTEEVMVQSSSESSAVPTLQSIKKYVRLCTIQIMHVQDMLSEKVPSNAPGRTYKKWITYVHTCVCLSICKGKYMLRPWKQKWGEIFPPKFKEVIWRYALQSLRMAVTRQMGFIEFLTFFLTVVTSLWKRKVNTVVKRWPKSKSWLFWFLAGRPWTNYSAILCHRFSPLLTKDNNSRYTIACKVNYVY